MLTIFVFLMLISVLVLAHEFGHFLAARRVGIRVEEFALGLPFTKSIWSRKVGGVLVSLYPLLFGGFVKLTGEDNEPDTRDDPHSFANKSVGIRMVVVTAGVLMNVILGIVLYTGVLAARNFQTDVPMPFSYQFIGADVSHKTQVVILSIVEGSPAQQAGIKSPVFVTSLDGSPVESVSGLQRYLKQKTNTPVAIGLTDIKTDAPYVATVTPRADTPTGDGRIGVVIDEFSKAHLSYSGFPRILASGVLHSYNMTAYSLHIMGRIVAHAFVTKDIRPVASTVSGPVGIGQFVGEIIAAGDQVVIRLSELAALLSLSLALLNILPIPALDGGRLVFLALEAVAGRKVLAKAEPWVHRLGMALLFGLIIAITYNDVMRITSASVFFEKLRHIFAQ